MTTKLEPLPIDILFRFNDATRKGMFEDVSAGGLYLGRSMELSLQEARWGTVIEIGCDVKDVAVGDQILIEPLKWTDGFEIDSIKYWKTQERFVLAIGEE